MITIWGRTTSSNVQTVMWAIADGMSPGRYYLKRRLERAHDLLMFTRLPLHEISLACGFSSLTQFNRRYRNVKGMSPAKMRSTTERHV